MLEIIVKFLVNLFGSPVNNRALVDPSRPLGWVQFTALPSGERLDCADCGPKKPCREHWRLGFQSPQLAA